MCLAVRVPGGSGSTPGGSGGAPPRPGGGMPPAGRTSPRPKLSWPPPRRRSRPSADGSGSDPAMRDNFEGEPVTMRIAIGVGGEVTGTPMSPQDVVDDVVRAEADGFGAAWSVHFSRGVDALDILAVAGARTSRIELGVGIVPTYPRHP